ncbi:ATPase/histidine kinase/DNA gyrase B/HSP90 domain protein [Aeromicrobium marinum DSM 15272]|uniref:histidine kinase n=1 Tax=Aeromicrobium marinum DSM 15272 TaxID=585531 RepID=E2SFC7_9ACTN|nr:HAMP domain-containing sensor histidine kinase [Aeromicrobium marinum]EFQ82028.1 ATPase/histidine kinase/DNA gyrase B/HSP90 domain protein [Aeromicrobium marinum DSM 15272]
MIRGATDAAHRRVHRFTSKVSLAARVTLITTAAVALTLGSMSALVYFVVRAELVSNLDTSITARAEQAVAAGYSPGDLTGTQAELLDVAGIDIFRVEGGQLIATLTGNQSIRPTHKELEVSIGRKASSARTATIDGDPYRVVAVQAGPGSALVMVQPMESVTRTLDRLGLILLLTSTAGGLVAGMVGWTVAANGLRPVRRLTAAAEHVARTHELHPIEVSGRDELARLTIAFNQMLVALDASQEGQRQLVADAGHELRTPLTSLRTNIELLRQAGRSDRPLSDDQRDEIMADVGAQVEELTTLIGDLVELARDEPLQNDPEPLDLAEVVTQSLDRVRLRAPSLTFDVDLSPWMVIGEPRMLERAVTNLLDNAAKWSPAGGTVRVRLTGGAVVVSDDGPGISPDDLPHVFDRFYRSTEARTLPGSGLGLSIVRRCAERHGGSVTVTSDPGEGATFSLSIPAAPDSSGPHTRLSDLSQR